jgi:pimeloyl-ACP methyl ester carboxylesterase
MEGKRQRAESREKKKRIPFLSHSGPTTHPHPFRHSTFGGSSGEPRHWASPARHVDDILAAADWARGPGLAGRVDAARLALWGSSLAGGHALVAGARLAPPPSAVVAQVPHLSGPAAARAGMAARGLAGTLRLGRAAVLDAVRGALGLPPVFVRVAGGRGDLAFMQLAAEELAAYFAKHPPAYSGGWRNQVRARLALEIGRYSPIKSVPALACPALLVVAEADSVCPPSLAADAAALAPPGRVRVHTLKGVGHFDVYAGPAFKEAVAAEGDFLVEVLGA